MAKKGRPPAEGPHRVKCLGPIEPPHQFGSFDRIRQRICPRCRLALAGLSKTARPHRSGRD